MAELLLNPEDRRPKIDKINEVGISSKTFYEWMKDKNYLTYLNDNIKQYVKGELADVWRSLLMQVKRGNVNAIKLYFELIGEYQQSVKQDITSTNTNYNIDDAARRFWQNATADERARYEAGEMTAKEMQEIVDRK